MNARQIKSASNILGSVNKTKSMPTTPAAPSTTASTPTVKSPVGKGTGLLGAMHQGGIIPKTGNYLMKKGETVIPASEDQGSSGRSSEYRKVFVARRQTRQGGGNTPVKGEQHDKSAKKIEADKKKA